MVSSKQELRLLRNKILAYHGYRFQSKDLQEYFGKVSWYKPGNDNNAIKLDIVEQTVLLPQFSVKAAVRIKNKIFFILSCKSKKLLQTFFLLQVVYSKI